MAKGVLIVAVCFAVLAHASVRLQANQQVVTQDMVDQINSSASWKASMDWVNDMTVGEAAKLLGGHREPHNFPQFKLNALAQYLTVPASFSWQGNACVGPIRNQGDCGSCWAFGAAESFSDRVCMGTNAGAPIVLSPQWLVSCDGGLFGNDGCGGGFLSRVWSYLESHGIPLDSCVPYTSGDNDESGSCPKSENCSFYKATGVTAYDGPANIQAGLLEGGPVETCFDVYQDFMSYSSGVYVHTTGSYLGGHCVKMLGWGNQNGTNYWIVANSWGTTWGQEGVFWIEFGQCGIDTEAMAGKYSA